MIANNPIELIIPNKLKVFKYIAEHKGEGVTTADIPKVFPFLGNDYSYQILLDLESIGLIFSWKVTHKNKKVDLTSVGIAGYDALFNGKIEDLLKREEEDLF